MTAPGQAGFESGGAIGVDIGGTFTDVVARLGATSTHAKSLTTHNNLADGVLAACEFAAREHGVTLQELLAGVQRFTLGTKFDVSVIHRGEPTRRTHGDVGDIWTALSMIDVVSIGAGGGSIGWIDACPVLEESREVPSGRTVIIRSYLEPVTGSLLAVESTLEGEQSTFSATPDRWLRAL